MPEHNTWRDGHVEFDPASLLIADTDPTVLDFLSGVLHDEGYEVTTASGSQEAVKAVREGGFQVLLIDLNMPGTDALSLLRALREMAPECDVVVLTPYAGMETAVEAMKLGAVDYITKPFHVDHVRIVVAKTLERRRLQRLARDGETHKYLSRVDGLTDLYNHKFFHQLLDAELERAQRYDRNLAILTFDIDHFKIYNDANGHPIGDSALQKIAAILTNATRKCDFIARYGGEEFAMMIPETDRQIAVRIAERLRKAVEDAEFQGESMMPDGRLTISIGVSAYPDDGRTKEELLAQADRALYRAKQEGRNRVCPAPDTPCSPDDSEVKAKAFDRPPLQSA
jgi:diguanylate cyclase (GGDEF)-like protein